MRRSSCCGRETDFTELIQANYYATKETKTKPTTAFRRKISESRIAIIYLFLISIFSKIVWEIQRKRHVTHAQE